MHGLRCGASPCRCSRGAAWQVTARPTVAKAKQRRPILRSGRKLSAAVSTRREVCTGWPATLTLLPCVSRSQGYPSARRPTRPDSPAAARTHCIPSHSIALHRRCDRFSVANQISARSDCEQRSCAALPIRFDSIRSDLIRTDGSAGQRRTAVTGSGGQPGLAS